MREIKFRGMELGSRAWVYGYLVPDAERGEWQIAGSLEHIDGAEFNSDARLIDPATVGQYTGESDRDGVEIYEGDTWDWDNGEDNGVVTFEDGAFICNEEYQLSWMVDDIKITGNVHEPKP